jgi:hypothetical protein
MGGSPEAKGDIASQPRLGSRSESISMLELSYSVTGGDLRQTFEAFGDVETAKVLR